MTFNNENNNDCCKCTTPEYEIILNEQGPQGRQGKKGEAGFTPIISVKDNTDSNYTLNILTQDGQITTPNLKANLPAGGATGQVLTKNSANQDDCSWQNLPNATEEIEGIARLATETDFTTTEDSAVSDTSIVTPALFNNELKAQVNTFIVAGDNITTSVDDDGKVTINAEAYSLPQANATTLGGIKANPKTDDDTQAVNIDTTTGLLYTKAGGGVSDAYTKAETDNLLDDKQDKLVATTGIEINDNNIGINQKGTSLIEYNNTNRDIGYIEDDVLHQEQTVIEYIEGIAAPIIDIPDNVIHSFDISTVVKLSGYNDKEDSRIIEIGGNGTNAVFFDTHAYHIKQMVRMVYILNGTPTAYWHETIQDNKYLAVRFTHDGTTLKFFTKVVDTPELPTDWNEWENIPWDLSLYPIEKGDLPAIINIGGEVNKNPANDIISTLNIQKGLFYLNQTRIIINNTLFSYTSSNYNDAIATTENYGLVKIDGDSLIINENYQLQANIPSNLTTQGNTFNGASQLVQLDSSGKLPAIDGSQLTNLPSVAPSNIVTTDTDQTITALKRFDSAAIFNYNNKPSIAIGNTPTSISMSYEGAISADSAHILRDTSTDWRVGRYNKQGIISSSTPLQRMGAAPYFTLYPILDSSNLGSYVDGTTITYTDGKLKASGSSAPSNMMTTDTSQTITVAKTFKNLIIDASALNQQTALRAIICTSSTGRMICNVLHFYTNSDTYATTLSIGSSFETIRIGDRNATITDANGNEFLTSANIPTGTLKYWTGTETDYTGLEAKNADTLYRTTDTNKVYLGTIQLGGS